MRRSSVAVAVIAALVVLLPASSASAHAAFVGAPSAYPGNTEQALTMRVPRERDNTTYNVAVSIRVPASWRALSCQSKATWTCSIEIVGGREVVRFAKSPDAAVSEDETFQFTVRTSTDGGTFPFETVQTYNTGEVVSWIGAAGTANPAPMLSTVAATTPPSSVTTTSTTSTSTSLMSTTTLPAPSSATTIAGGDSDDDDGSGTTTVGLVALIVVGAVIGLFVSRRYSHSRLRKSA